LIPESEIRGFLFRERGEEGKGGKGVEELL